MIVLWEGVNALTCQLARLPNHLDPVLNYLRAVSHISRSIRSLLWIREQFYMTFYPSPILVYVMSYNPHYASHSLWTCITLITVGL